MKKLKEVKPPRGISRWLFKLPNIIYNAGMGSLMGNRFIQLRHIGRSSGRQHKTVIEVVRFDPGSNKVWVASGFKEKSDWLKNIQANPKIEVNLNGRMYNAVANRLDGSYAAEVLLDYAHRHSLAMQELAKFMGYQIDGSDKDVSQLAGELPIIEIQLFSKEK